MAGTKDMPISTGEPVAADASRATARMCAPTLVPARVMALRRRVTCA